jgi:ribulose-phosphate 3-epimerase
MNKNIIPAILTTDLEKAVAQAKAMDGAANWLQLDVTDGQFVSFISCQPSVLIGVLKKTKLEAHLMVSNSAHWLEACLSAGVRRVHLPVETNVSEEIIKQYQQNNIEVFLSVNPQTPLEAVCAYAELVSGYLLLAVEPGRSGQQFINYTYNKITEFKNKYPNKIIIVDGGINLANINQVFFAGADAVAINSAIFNQTDWLEAYYQLKQK